MTNSNENPYAQQRNPEVMRQRIVDTIQGSREAIEKELAKDYSTSDIPEGNFWLGCYSTRVGVLYGLIDLAEGILPEHEITAMGNKLDAITAEVELLKGQGENPSIPLPKETREALLKKLDILAADDKETPPSQS